MSVHMFGRFGVALFVIALVSGCASSPSSDVGRLTGGNECRWDPDSCMYEGSYEPGEEEYAEQRAQELNRASAEKLRRRSSGWW